MIFLTSAILPVSLMGALSFFGARDALREAALDRMHVISEFKESETLLYLDKLKTRTLDFSSDGFIEDNLRSLDGQGPENDLIRQSLSAHLKDHKKTIDKDILFIDVLDLRGKVTASSIPKRVGLDLSEEQYFKTGQKQAYVSDIHRVKMHGGMRDLAVASPVRERVQSMKLIGVLVNHFDMAQMDKVFKGQLALELGAKTQHTGIGKTGETYLVSPNKQMINTSRFVEKDVLHQGVDTYPVRKCLESDQEVVGSWLNYQGIAVVGSSMCIRMGDYSWILVSEQHEDEALAPINRLRTLSLIIGIIVLVLAGVAASLTAKAISGPIARLYKGAEIIGGGNLGYKVGTNSTDEIGQLSREFDRMSEHLKEIMASRDELDREITMRKVTEELLKKSEEKLKKAQEIAHIGNWDWDIVNNNLSWSDEVFRIFGRDPEEFEATYESFLSFVHPDDVKHVKQCVDQALKKGVPYEINHRIVLPTGKEKVVHEQGEVVFKYGKAVGMVGVVEDITESKRNLDELLERTEELERMNKDLKEFTDIVVDRELLVIELKREVNKLSEELGQAPPYDLSFVKEEDGGPQQEDRGENNTISDA